MSLKTSLHFHLSGNLKYNLNWNLNLNQNVQYHSHLSDVKGLYQSRRIHDASAGAIDNPDAFLALLEVCLSDEALSLRGEGSVQRDEVRPREKLTSKKKHSIGGWGWKQWANGRRGWGGGHAHPPA